ncbi:hypothetical protein [Cyanobium sp. ATX 6F1]|uniref:hypothetical protein n=1 Tax=unclassified Cyanobium TaxID=2627006 RepID=UPI0020CDF8E9|nr:hypothetical protein [Cyanobium sp. ATX 6F1]MCP9917681.1 hypothetical protein [Cyanobium sp. ATX 6F1]
MASGNGTINGRLVVFAALMTAVLGALFGFTLRYLGQPDLGQPRFESAFYQDLYHWFPLIGAGLGAVFGAGFAVVSQTARARQRASSRRRSRR